ncbi:cell death-inducing p53-target protein 1-like [Pholidichthys leucotaenia]
MESPSAPPYPGPPLDKDAGNLQVQPNFPPSYQQSVQPGFHPVIQPVIQTVQQPAPQQLPQAVVVVSPHLPTSVPGQMKCPHCNVDVVTKIDYTVGCYTWTVCGILAAFLCWPCCLIPFCVKDCKDVEHSCPTCNAVIHIYKRM